MLKNFRRGFMLIELLVVIAIIAALAAILFAVFAQARELVRPSRTFPSAGRSIHSTFTTIRTEKHTK